MNGDAATMTRRHLSLALAAAGATVALSAPTGAAAAGDEPHLTSLRVGSLTVADSACHELPVKVRFDAAGERVDGISVKIFHGSEQVGFVTARPEQGASRASTTVRWCAGSPLGRYVAGPSTITYRHGGAETSTEDQRTTVFHARRASRLTLLRDQVDGGSADVVARLVAYSPDAGRFTAAAGVPVRLQSRPAGGRWSTVQAGTTNRRGRVELAGTGHRDWRVLARATATIARAQHRA